MSKYVLDERLRKNALLFLNKAPVTGIEENQAYMELVQALHTPVEESKEGGKV